jgi:hypothetical protein
MTSGECGFGYPMDEDIPHDSLPGALTLAVAALTGGRTSRRDEGLRCGARTRARTPCRRPPAKGRTRCKLHGGKSLRGRSHPRFKHGRYSKFTLEGRRRIEEAERRRRERETRRENRYVSDRYEYWVECEGGLNSAGKIGKAMALMRRWREEYREREAERRRQKGLPPLGAVERDPALNWIIPLG